MLARIRELEEENATLRACIEDLEALLRSGAAHLKAAWPHVSLQTPAVEAYLQQIEDILQGDKK